MPTLISFLQALPWILICLFVWRWLVRKNDHARKLRRAMSKYRANKLTGGCCWLNKKSSRAYTVLWVTNQERVGKKGWELHVTYTIDFKNMYTRPISEFCDKFFYFEAYHSGSDLRLDELLQEATGRVSPDGTLHVPTVGDVWFQGTCHSVPEDLQKQGHPPQFTTKVFANIEEVFGLGRERPIVIYSIDGKRYASLVYQFCELWQKQDQQ